MNREYTSTTAIGFLAELIKYLTEAIDVVVSDLEGLLSSDVPLSATTETMIRSSVATLKDAGQ